MAIDTDITLRRLIYEFSQWSESHDMIRKFGYGKYLNVYSETSREYPAFIVNCPRAPIEQWYINYNLEFIVLDWVFDSDQENENRERVNSDTHQLLEDLENTLRYSNRWQQFSRIDGRFEVQKIDEFGGDKCYGWLATVTLKVKKKSGICDLSALMPEYDFETQSVTCGASVTANDTLMVELECCEDYVFSIKDSLGATVGSWNATTKTWTVPAAGGGSIPTTVNGVAASDSEDPLAIVVRNSVPANVGTLTTDTANNKTVTVGDSLIQFQGNDMATNTPAEQPLNIEVVDSSSTIMGAPLVDTPTNKIIVIQDKTTNVYLDGVLFSMQTDPAAETVTINISL